MKKLLFGLVATVMLSVAGNAQTTIELPEEIAGLIKSPIKEANISNEEAEVLIKKLVLLNNSLKSVKDIDYKTLLAAKTSNVSELKNTEYLNWISYYNKCITQEDLINKSLDLINLSKSSKEIVFHIYTNYSIQLMNAYNVTSATSKARVKRPCSNIDILTAAACGCAITGGPWGGVGALCLIAYFGC